MPSISSSPQEEVGQSHLSRFEVAIVSWTDDGADEGSVGEVDLRKGIVEAWAPRKGGR